MPLYKEMDADLLQLQIRWERVALQRPQNPTDPNDPAYRWPRDIDLAVEEGKRLGVGVLLLVQGAPGWANGGGEWSQPPDDVRDFADFLTAVATRYSTVRHWIVWGEPLRNMSWPGGDLSRPARLRVAQTYARLLDRGYAALKRVSKRNVVIGGNSFTTSHKPEDWAPVPLYEWIRIMRLPDGRPPRMDVWGHNPYTLRYPRLADPTGVWQGDFSDLDRVLRTLRRKVARPLRRKIPLFVSEWCLPTGPNNLFPIELTFGQQARWLKRAFTIAREQRDVWGMGWWRLRDDVDATGDNRVNRCGLLDHAGERKPAFDVFRRARTVRR